MTRRAPRRGRARCGRSWSPDELLAEQARAAGCLELRELGAGAPAVRPDEVVVGLSPAFARDVWLTLGGLTRGRGAAPGAGGHRGGGRARRASCACCRSIDVGDDRLDGRAARGLGQIGIGLQAQGHRADPPRRPAAAGQPRAASRSRRASTPRAVPRPRAATPRATRAAPSREPLLPARVERAVRPPLPRSRGRAGGGRAPRGRSGATRSSWSAS